VIKPFVTATALALVLTLLSPAAQADTPDPGQLRYLEIPIQETGVVDLVADGDTFRFIESGTSEYVTIRLLGVNTPEVRGFNNVHRDKDMCGGAEATDVLKSVLQPGTKVQLRSLDKSSENRGRIRRYAFAWNPLTERYDIDVQAVVAQSGLAMWFTIKNEAFLSYQYRVMIAQTQIEKRGIWNPNYCGPLEQPNADISVIVNWDAEGNDNENVNGEFVVVRNIGDQDVDLTGWLLRDSSLIAWFYFPGGSVLAPNDFRVVHVGKGVSGTPNPRDLYMGSDTALFPNVVAGLFLGDGAYLLDRNTAMRSYNEYPCVLDCSDPLQGVLRITEVNPVATAKRVAKRANQEYVRIRNDGLVPALLDGYYLRRGVSTYPFLVNSVIEPGRSLTVRIGKGTPTRVTQYWGKDSTLLRDRGDRVALMSNRNVTINANAWGPG
jgi:endonuclease YncB( thermonuclease family)